MVKVKYLLLAAVLILGVSFTERLVAAESEPAAASANEPAPKLSGPTPMTKVVPAPAMPSDVTDDKKRMRNYPEQPPVIPHSIAGYQVDRNFNKCLSCHSRQFSEGSQAPMISVTHYMNRDGQMQAGVSPRRYFCTACHVPQTNAVPLEENTFVDMDALPRKSKQGDK